MYHLQNVSTFGHDPLNLGTRVVPSSTINIFAITGPRGEPIATRQFGYKSCC